MGRKIIQPEKYGMVVCPECKGQGYIQAPKRQPCPKCGGFGWIKEKDEKDEKHSKNDSLDYRS